MQSKPLGQKSPPNIKWQIELSRKLNAKMKLEILKYVNSSSRYDKGRVFDLSIPSGMTVISSKIRGCSLGADSKGFFVYTHRARGKSYANPLKIPKKEIDFIESTG